MVDGPLATTFVRVESFLKCLSRHRQTTAGPGHFFRSTRPPSLSRTPPETPCSRLQEQGDEHGPAAAARLVDSQHPRDDGNVFGDTALENEKELLSCRVAPWGDLETIQSTNHLASENICRKDYSCWHHRRGGQLTVNARLFATSKAGVTISSHSLTGTGQKQAASHN